MNINKPLKIALNKPFKNNPLKMTPKINHIKKPNNKPHNRGLN